MKLAASWLEAYKPQLLQFDKAFPWNYSTLGSAVTFHQQWRRLLEPSPQQKMPNVDPFWASRHPGIPHFYANPWIMERGSSVMLHFHQLQLQHDNSHRGALKRVSIVLSWVSSVDALMVNYYGSQPKLVSSLGKRGHHSHCYVCGCLW